MSERRANQNTPTLASGVVYFDKDEHYKYVSDDLYKNCIFDDNDNKIANNVRRKVKTTDEIANLKDKKKNDTRF